MSRAGVRARLSARGRGRRTPAGDLGKAKALRPRGLPSSSHSQAGRPLATLRLAAGGWPAAASPELRPNGDQGGRGGPWVQALEGTLRVFQRAQGESRAWNVLKPSSLPRTPVLPAVNPTTESLLNLYRDKGVFEQSECFFWALHSQGMLLE